MTSWGLIGNKTNWQAWVLQLLNQTNSESSDLATAHLCEAAGGLCHIFVFMNSE